MEPSSVPKAAVKMNKPNQLFLTFEGSSLFFYFGLPTQAKWEIAPLYLEAVAVVSTTASRTPNQLVPVIGKPIPSKLVANCSFVDCTCITYCYISVNQIFLQVKWSGPSGKKAERLGLILATLRLYSATTKGFFLAILSRRLFSVPTFSRLFV